MSKLTPEQEKVYERIWEEKLNNLNGRTLTDEDWRNIKWGIGLSTVCCAGASIGFRGLYKYSKPFNNYAKTWRKLTFAAWASTALMCLTPAFSLPMRIPYKSYIEENYRQPTGLPTS